MANEVTVYEKLADPIATIKALGEIISKSGMAGCEKIEQGEMLAWECIAQKKSPFEILREFHLVSGGKLTMRADNMLARFMAAGGTVEWKQFDTEAAIGIWSFGTNQKIEISYTIEDAKKALPNLWSGVAWKAGSGYAKDPAAQIRARCISKAVRMICPQAIVGLHLPDEIGETAIDAAPVITSAPLLGAKSVAEDTVTVSEPVVTVMHPTPEPVKRKPGRPPKVVDVKPDPEAAKPAGGPMAAPVVPATQPPPAPVETSQAEAVNNDIFVELENLIAPFRDNAMKWFVAKQWLALGCDDLRQFTDPATDNKRTAETMAKDLLARPQVFAQAVKTYCDGLKAGA